MTAPAYPLSGPHRRRLLTVYKSGPTCGEVHTTTTLGGGAIGRRRRGRHYRIGPILKPVLDSLAKGDEFYPYVVVKDGADERLVVGWASVITNPDGSTLCDLQKDEIEEHEMVLAAHGYFEKSRRIGHVHQRSEGVGEMVEHFCLTKQSRADLSIPASVPTGWLIAAKVWADDTWAGIKDGTFQGFSIGGTAVQEYLD